MEALQILILILGALIFTVSFFIPDKQVNTKETRDREEHIFRELVEKEIPDIQKKIDDVTQDSLERAKENIQRQMERLTNEKMMAINEYSDTVMSEIHKNHEEAVFLYDMLNNKHAQVKNTAAELNQVMKQSKQVQSAVKSTKVKEDKKPVKPSSEERAVAAVELVESVENAKAAKKATTDKKASVTDDKKSVDKKASVTDDKKSVDKKAAEKEETTFEPMVSEDLEVIIPPEEMTKTVDETVDVSNAGNVEIMFATEGNEENSNDRILEMHKAGKSNMAIARELGLGIGEVKLVIDLFKGGM